MLSSPRWARTAGQSAAVIENRAESLAVPGLDEFGVTSALLERGWAVALGERFRIASAPGIRIGTATLEESESARLAADLAECIRRRPRRTD